MKEHMPSFEEKKEGVEEGVEKHPSTWRRVTKTAGIAAVAALLGMLSHDSTEAQKGERPGENPEKEAQAMVEKAHGLEETIISKHADKGQDGMLRAVHIRDWIAAPEHAGYNMKVVAGYGSADRKTPLWVFWENSTHDLRFYDRGADGSIDRVIRSGNPTLSFTERSALLDWYTFLSMDELHKGLRESPLPGHTRDHRFDDIDVYEIVRELKEQGKSVRIIGGGGEAMTVTGGPDAKAARLGEEKAHELHVSRGTELVGKAGGRLANQLQSEFAGQLQGFERQIRSKEYR